MIKTYAFSVDNHPVTFKIDTRKHRRVYEILESWRAKPGFNISLKIRHLIEQDELKQQEIGPHDYELQQRLSRMDQYYMMEKHGETIIMLYKSGILNADDIYNIFKSARLALRHIDWNKEMLQIVDEKMIEEKEVERRTRFEKIR